MNRRGTTDLWTELYPRSGQAWNGLSSVQRDLGHQADSLVASQRALALLPDQQGNYTNVAYSQMQTGDLKGAVATCEAAIAKGLDGDHVRWHLLETAYAMNDPSLAQKQLDWIAAHPEAPFVREQEAEIAMAAGRISRGSPAARAGRRNPPAPGFIRNGGLQRNC